jgi:hypothetical protein
MNQIEKDAIEDIIKSDKEDDNTDTPKLLRLAKKYIRRVYLIWGLLVAVISGISYGIKLYNNISKTVAKHEMVFQKITDDSINILKLNKKIDSLIDKTNKKILIITTKEVADMEDYYIKNVRFKLSTDSLLYYYTNGWLYYPIQSKNNPSFYYYYDESGNAQWCR